MGRARNQGKSDRGPRPRLPRDKQRILDITADIPRQHRGLERAVNAFGGPGAFDHDAYLAARASQDEEFDKTALVERYWSVLQNHVATLAELGLSEARRLGVPGARNAGKTFAGLADIGVITRADAERLTEVQDIRNEDQHRYPAQTLRLVRAMLDLNRVLPRFMKRYGDWFGKLPY